MAAATFEGFRGIRNHDGRSGFIQWITEWKMELFYGFMALTFACLVVVPIFSVSEEMVNGEFPLMTHEELESETERVLRVMQHLPVREDSMAEYFEVIFAHRAVEAQCEWLHAKMPMVFMDTHHPCYRLERDGHRFENDLFNRYHGSLGHNQLASLIESYYSSHPEKREGKGPLPVLRVWHPEKLWESYTGGVVWFSIWFLFRIRTKGFRMDWELMFGRYMAAVLAWPVTFWFYPGDQREQAREIRRWCGYILSSLISCFGAGAKLALADTSVGFAGGANIQSQYTIDTGKTLTPGWVVQPWVEASWLGGYLGVWASAGLEHSQGNEVDFTGGYRFTVDGVKIEASYNYYRFVSLSEGIHAPKVVVCSLEFSLCGKFQYMIPDTGAQPGMQFGLTWSHQWKVVNDYTIGTHIGVVHTREVYGNAPVTQLKLEASAPLPFDGWGWLKVFGRVYVPVQGGDDVNGLIGLSFAF